MNTLTCEELLLQILATCLLINIQGNWHAFYDLSGHVGTVYVRLVHADTDYQDGKHTFFGRDATFTSTKSHPRLELTEDLACQRLMEVLAWVQGYLNKEAAA